MIRLLFRLSEFRKNLQEIKSFGHAFSKVCGVWGSAPRAERNGKRRKGRKNSPPDCFCVGKPSSGVSPVPRSGTLFCSRCNVSDTQHGKSFQLCIPFVTDSVRIIFADGKYRKFPLAIMGWKETALRMISTARSPYGSGLSA